MLITSATLKFIYLPDLREQLIGIGSKFTTEYELFLSSSELLKLKNNILLCFQ